MTRFRVRRATMKDIGTLTEQRHKMFADIGERPRRELAVHDRAFKAWAAKEMRAKRLVCFLVENGLGKIVGGGSVWLRQVQPYPGYPGGKMPYLMSMYTEPACRGRGVGRLVARHAIEWCKAQGFPSMTLHASEIGRPLYEKLGWKQSNEMKLQVR